MSVIEESVDVDVPVRTAYNQWTQFEEFPRFMAGVERIEQRTDTLTHWTTSIGGVRREFDAKIIEQHPDQRVSWQTLDRPKQHGTVTFHPLDAGHTRVMLHMEFDPEGFVEKAGDALGVVEQRIHGDLARFKDFIEDRQRETGSWRGDINAAADLARGTWCRRPSSIWASIGHTEPGRYLPNCPTKKIPPATRTESPDPNPASNARHTSIEATNPTTTATRLVR